MKLTSGSLEPGDLVRVVKDLESPFSTVKKGQQLEFLGEKYSRYDSATVLLFKDTATEDLFQLYVFDGADGKPVVSSEVAPKKLRPGEEEPLGEKVPSGEKPPDGEVQGE